MYTATTPFLLQLAPLQLLTATLLQTSEGPSGLQREHARACPGSLWHTATADVLALQHLQLLPFCHVCVCEAALLLLQLGQRCLGLLCYSLLLLLWVVAWPSFAAAAWLWLAGVSWHAALWLRWCLSA